MIAEKLGISQPAVGAILGNFSRNSRIRVRPETRQRILETARQLGYRLNRHAQGLSRGRSGVIGILETSGMLQVSIQRTDACVRIIRELGYHPLIVTATGYPNERSTACQTLIDARVEGVLLQNVSLGLPELRYFLDAEVPMVSLTGPRFPHVPQVCSDPCHGMRMLTDHLIHLGHRRMLLLLSAPGFVGDVTQLGWQSLERIQGFRAAREAAGLGEEAGDMMIENATVDVTSPHQTGLLAMQKILRRAVRPEVIVASNDDLAIGVLGGAAQAGLRVPEDIAVTGFDNLPIGEMAMVSLTTVAQQTEVMARKSVDLLMRLIRGEEIPESEQQARVPCQLVVRRSCGAKQRTPPVAATTIAHAAELVQG